MLKGVIPYNYTALGLRSLEKAIRFFDRPGMDLYACYMPQSVCLDRESSNRASFQLADEKRIVRNHFQDLQRRIENRNVRLHFGEFISDKNFLAKYLFAGGFDFIANGQTGNEKANSPFLAKQYFLKITEKTDCLVLKLPSMATVESGDKVLLLSNANEPFFAQQRMADFLTGSSFHFKHLRTRESTNTTIQKLERSVSIILKRKMDSSEIMLGSPIEAVKELILKQNWSQVIFECQTNSTPELKAELKKLIELAYKKTINLQIITTSIPEEKSAERMVEIVGNLN